jgi:hypothetical protein
VPEIFLSYRRQDSQSATGRLADRLEAHFGPARVFRDHDSIAAGDDFAESISRAIAASSVVLVVIGPDWLDVRLADGRRRLDDPGDFVRLEIEAALAQDIPLVPVLVESAPMPAAAAVPASLQAFTRCQAMELSETRWRYDAERLIQALQTRFAIEALPLAPPLAGQTDRSPRWMHAAARMAVDLLDLATHPTRLILRRQTGQATDHIRAFLFLIASLCAGNALLLMTYAVPTATPRGPLDALVHALGLLFFGAVFWVSLITFGLIVMAIAWRLAGTRVQFRQLSVVMAYVASGLYMGACLGAFFLGLGLQLVDDQAFGRVIRTLLEAQAVPGQVQPWAARLDGIGAELQALRTIDPLPLAMMIAGVTWLATAGWLLVAWQGFNLSFGVSRWRTAWATLIWLVLLAGAARVVGGALVPG